MTKQTHNKNLLNCVLDALYTFHATRISTKGSPSCSGVMRVLLPTVATKWSLCYKGSWKELKSSLRYYTKKKRRRLARAMRKRQHPQIEHEAGGGGGGNVNKAVPESKDDMAN